MSRGVHCYFIVLHNFNKFRNLFKIILIGLEQSVGCFDWQHLVEFDLGAMLYYVDSECVGRPLNLKFDLTASVR